MSGPILAGNAHDVYEAELAAARRRLESAGFHAIAADEVALACSIAANEPLTDPANVADLLQIRRARSEQVAA